MKPAQISLCRFRSVHEQSESIHPLPTVVPKNWQPAVINQNNAEIKEPTTLYTVI